jgi:hypothetical protein
MVFESLSRRPSMVGTGCERSVARLRVCQLSLLTGGDSFHTNRSAIPGLTATQRCEFPRGHHVENPQAVGVVMAPVRQPAYRLWNGTRDSRLGTALRVQRMSHRGVLRLQNSRGSPATGHQLPRVRTDIHSAVSGFRRGSRCRRSSARVVTCGNGGQVSELPRGPGRNPFARLSQSIQGIHHAAGMRLSMARGLFKVRTAADGWSAPPVVAGT